MTLTADIAAALGLATRTPTWPRRCGYCQAHVEADQASQHWRRGRVSRCHHRTETP